MEGEYRVMAIEQYEIIYNANGGSNAPSMQLKTHNTAITLSTNSPTRIGYTFIGWAKTNSANNAQYLPGERYSTNANLTLYAVWIPNTYTVKYYSNGGIGAPPDQKKIHDTDLVISSRTPIRNNYIFLGWRSYGSSTVDYFPGSTYYSNSNLHLYAVWQFGYVDPVINNLVANRCDASGNLSDNGNNILVEFGWRTTNARPSITVECISSSGTSTNTVSANGISGDASVIVGNNLLSTESTYKIVVTVNDSDGETSMSEIVTGSLIAFDVMPRSAGVSFGKAADKSGYADFAYKSQFRDNMYIENLKIIYGTSSNGTTKEIINPVNASGNLAIGYGNYSAKSGNTYLYGKEVYFGVNTSNNSMNVYKPYYSKGDSEMNISIKTSGYVTNSGMEVTFMVPLSKPIVGSTTITAMSINGFALRQNNNYTHGSQWVGGSTEYAYAKPMNYTVSKCCGGVVITALFTSSTNATNNAPIGIYWNGGLIFS